MAARWLELYDGIGSRVWLIRLNVVELEERGVCATYRLKE